LHTFYRSGCVVAHRWTRFTFTVTGCYDNALPLPHTHGYAHTTRLLGPHCGYRPSPLPVYTHIHTRCADITVRSYTRSRSTRLQHSVWTPVVVYRYVWTRYRSLLVGLVRLRIPVRPTQHLTHVIPGLRLGYYTFATPYTPLPYCPRSHYTRFTLPLQLPHPLPPVTVRAHDTVHRITIYAPHLYTFTTPRYVIRVVTRSDLLLIDLLVGCRYTVYSPFVHVLWTLLYYLTFIYCCLVNTDVAIQPVVLTPFLPPPGCLLRLLITTIYLPDRFTTRSRILALTLQFWLICLTLLCPDCPHNYTLPTHIPHTVAFTHTLPLRFDLLGRVTRFIYPGVATFDSVACL